MATTNNYEYSEESLSTNLTLAKSYLYMALGLLLSAFVAFGTSFLFSFLLGSPDLSTDAQGAVAITYIVIMIATFVGLLIDSFVISKVIVKGQKSAWPPYIVYACLMGVFLSSFMLVGIDFKTMGMALAITALAFTIMFVIGAKCKGAHPILTAMAGFGIGAVLILLVASIFALFFGGWTQYLMMNIVASMIVLVITILVAGIDGARCAQIIEQGALQKNLALYCAFIMYGDFVIIFIRVLYFLLIVMGGKSRR
ncbi:MAG: Bax inhibitor-1 family protein [Bacilli bacterium]|nr:Bax inhibitor-1 family protein [Bacilli bacterium]